MQIKNLERLKAWLRGKPHDVAVALAARAALRVLPVMQMAATRGDYADSIVWPVFRATAVSWDTVKYPAHARPSPSADAAGAPASYGATHTDRADGAAAAAAAAAITATTEVNAEGAAATAVANAARATHSSTFFTDGVSVFTSRQDAFYQPTVLSKPWDLAGISHSAPTTRCHSCR